MPFPPRLVLQAALPKAETAPRATAPALWLLVLAQLNPDQFDFGIPQLADLLSIDPSTLRKFAGQLGLRATRERTQRGRRQHLQQYRLNWNQACALVNYAGFRSRSLDADEEYARLLAERKISPDQDWKRLADEANEALKGFRRARAAELERQRGTQSTR